jgi:heme/copper-type cytochrome/quinol oxidase subunit 4
MTWKFHLAFLFFYLNYKLTLFLHINGKDRKNLEKRSVRLKAFCKKAASEAYAYHRISPLEKGIQKNLGITAIERLFCHRSGLFKICSLTYIVTLIVVKLVVITIYFLHAGKSNQESAPLSILNIVSLVEKEINPIYQH